VARCRALLVVGVFGLIAAACSGNVEFSFGGQSPAEAAVDLIESDAMAQRLAIDTITDASCEDPPNSDEGTVFVCTAMSGGEVVEFDVLIEPDDRIFAGPTNVVAADFLSDYAESAVEALNTENGFTLASDAMDCGTRAVVLDASRQMSCTLTDGGQAYDALLTVRDVNLGTFGIEIVGPAE